MTHKTFIIMLCAALLVAWCNNSESIPENYSDALFVEMLNDTTFLHQERVLQDTGELAFYASFEQPLLWPETGDTTLRRMADFFNLQSAFNGMYTDEHTYQRYNGEIERDLEKEMLAVWAKMKLPGIADTFTMRRLGEAMKFILSKSDDEKKKDVTDCSERLSTWLPDVDSTNVADKIIPVLTPKTYLPKKLKEDYELYVGEEAKPDQEQLKSLYKSYLEEKDFNAKLSMLFMLLYDYHYDGGDTVVSLLKDAEQVMTSGNYSPLLPVLWRAYRVDYCNKYSCPSTYCEIPNVRFNYYRRLVAYTMLRHIQNTPDDDAAKVAFYSLAWRDNINRFGQYYFGNQSTAEYIVLFWNGSVL